MAINARLKQQMTSGLLVGLALLIIGSGFWFAYQFVEPAPPNSLRLAAGPESGAYYQYALAYQRRMTKNAVAVEVIATKGSVENSRLLLAGEVDVGFVQGGVAREAGQPDREGAGLESLGSMYFEPLWIFTRTQATATPPQRLSELAGKRLAIGREGSGTRALALELLKEAGLAQTGKTNSATQLLSLGNADSLQALLAGRVDALFYVGSVESELVKTLLGKEAEAAGIQLMSFARADALTRRHPYLSVLKLPEGVLNLDDNIPNRNIQLVGATANLVTRPGGLHPALVDLLLQAASAEHKDSGIFANRGSFPQPRFLGFPINEDAERFYKHGPPFLQRYLPFWAASLIDRLKVMLLPLLALMIPLFKVMPPALRLPATLRINKWYKELQAIDEAFREHDHGAGSATELRQRLQALRADIQPVDLPHAHARMGYDLLMHIDWMQRELSTSGDHLPK